MEGPKSTAGILQHVLDNAGAALRVSPSSVTIDNVSIAVEMDSADGAALVTGGVASSAAQTTGNSSLSAIDVNTARNNREKVLRATDCVATYTWSDWGTADQRLASIVYTSAAGSAVTKTFAYTLVSGAYRLNTVTWS